MTLEHTIFGDLYLFIERNSETTRRNNGFQLVEEFCANHNLDADSLKELSFYFGANRDEEILTKVKGNISGKAAIRPRGYTLNKLARS